MESLIVPILVVAFAPVCLYDPKRYHKLLAPLCPASEDELPEFSIVGAFLLFGCVLYVKCKYIGEDITSSC